MGDAVRSVQGANHMQSRRGSSNEPARTWSMSIDQGNRMGDRLFAAALGAVGGFVGGMVACMGISGILDRIDGSSTGAFSRVDQSGRGVLAAVVGVVTLSTIAGGVLAFNATEQWGDIQHDTGTVGGSQIPIPIPIPVPVPGQ